MAPQLFPRSLRLHALLLFNRQQSKESAHSSVRFFFFTLCYLRILGRLTGFNRELIRLDRLFHIPEASLDIPIDGVGRPLDIADKPFLLLGIHPSAGLAHLIKMEIGGIQPKLLRHYIGLEVRLPVVAAAHRIEASMGLFTGDGANGSGFIHPVYHIDGMLFGHILRLYLFFIFLVREEGISLLASENGAPGFLPLVEGSWMGDFRILLYCSSSLT